MFQSKFFRFIPVATISAIALGLSSTPVHADALSDAVSQYARCAGAMSSVAMHQEDAEAKAKYIQAASVMESMGQMYGTLGDLPDQIARDAADQGAREITKILMAKDGKQHTVFMRPCLEVIKNLPALEQEAVSASQAMLSLENEEVAKAEAFLKNYPQSPLAETIQRKLSDEQSASAAQ